MPTKEIFVKSKHTDKYDNPINYISKIDKWELLSGGTNTEKFAFWISIFLIVLSFFDLLFMFEILDGPPRWDPAASIIALVVSCFMPVLLTILASRKMNATVTPSTDPK
jgi:hypothetical protein